MNIFELKKKYNHINTIGLLPIIQTKEGVSYNISPKSVKDLKFKHDRISFRAQFNGVGTLCTIWVHNILEINCIFDVTNIPDNKV